MRAAAAATASAGRSAATDGVGRRATASDRPPTAAPRTSRPTAATGAPTRGDPSPTFWTALWSPTNRDTLLRLGQVSIAMFVLPLVAFYVSDRILRKYVEEKYSVSYAGAIAVLVVNLVAAAFILFAIYSEKSESVPGADAAKKDR